MMLLTETVASFVHTRWHSRRGLDRARFEAWQHRALHKWLTHDLRQVAFYKDAAARLHDLPVIDKATLMGRFADFNTHQISAAQVRTALEADSRVSDVTVGASTGTSGHRGLFVISERERYRWLGNILAKALPDMIWQKQRVAILLPQGGALYDSARKTGRIDLGFFSLIDGPEQWQSALETFDPTVIVAPPKILRHMAETGFALAPKRIFAAAETLDPIDRPIIEAYFQQTLEQIYMATEGLLGVTCRLGRLHLAEDAIHFEYEPVGDGLVSPLITSFRRSTQILARYRMNDLLRLSAQPCTCGSPLRAVDEVVGRMDDCFEFDAAGGAVLITPDVLRNAVLGASIDITDFRLCQIARGKVLLRLPLTVTKGNARGAQQAVDRLLRARGVDAHVDLEQLSLPLETTRKLRRVIGMPKA